MARDGPIVLLLLLLFPFPALPHAARSTRTIRRAPAPQSVRRGRLFSAAAAAVSHLHRRRTAAAAAADDFSRAPPVNHYTHSCARKRFTLYSHV